MASFWVRLLTPQRIRLYPLVTFAVLVALAVWNRLAGSGLEDAISGFLGGDFMSFYTGGTFVLEGRSLDLTNQDAQVAFQEQVLGQSLDHVSLWVSPPYVAWIFAPLSRLPYVWAYLCFVGLSLSTVALSYRMLSRELPRLPGGLRLLWVSFQYYPTLQWLLNGQTTLLWLQLFLFVFIALRRGKDTIAGVLLGVFACKPPLAFGLAVALVAARRWSALAGATVSASAWLLVGFLTLPDAMVAYLERVGQLVSVVREPGYHTAGLHGSFEFAMLLLNDVAPTAATWLGILVTLSLLGVIGVWWWRIPWKPASRDWDFRIAATLALGVIASPHLYGYDLALLALPLFIVAAHFEAPFPHERPLDGGPLLRETALVWALGLLGPVLTVAQEELTASLFGTKVAVQFGVLAIAWWAHRILESVPRAGADSPLR